MVNTKYHTNKDDLNLISKKGLEGSFQILKKIVDSFEHDFNWHCFPKSNFNCEPNLGRRGLYPNISQKKNYNMTNLRMDLIAYSDGKKNLIQISQIIRQPINKIISELKLLVKNKILTF